MIRGALAALTLSVAGPVSAADLQLAFPLDCTLGQNCHIQQYMDHDPGPEARDYRCSGLSYDGHEGTDFALPDRAAMAAGVTVRAAAVGVVKGARDGMEDGPPRGDVTGRECGNGVVIDLGDGWETQYCHLKLGSVSVTQGQRVDVGTPLGEVGQSGQADFPHLHLALRRDGQPVDPFAPEALACDAPVEKTLWQEPPSYQAGGLLAVGFSDRIPDYDAIKAGEANQPELPVTAPALVVYGYSYGTQKGDVLRLALDGPGGTVVAQDVVMGKAQAQSFRAVGKRGRGNWPAGRYDGTVTLLRKGEVIDIRAATLTLR